ncbi:regulator [Rhodobacteraceae bacterium CCMM004]|nr:regulator [Rhodobacteraceae bacterium CCMM004]
MTHNKDVSSVMKQIDENLRQVYRDVETNDVPDRFKELLAKLKEQEASNAK